MKYLLILPGVLVLLMLIAVVRTLVSPRKTSGYQPPQTDEAEALRLAGKLSKMIQVDTTSHAGGDDPARFRAFHKTLAELFPRVFSQLEKTEIDGNLLFYWKGRSQERPILLMSHQDVVPAEGAWSHAPFSGDIADGKVWGRGASDTKCSVMAFFEAAEQLLAEGYTPPTDVYLASSCTEEWAGDGAPKLVAELQRRGVELFLVCDEGGAIISEPIGGIPGNFAMVGVFEKGKADVKFTAKSTGGHASAPKPHSPLVALSEACTKIESHPFKAHVTKPVAEMFDTLGRYSNFTYRMIFANLWLFGDVLDSICRKSGGELNALMRTTVAFTQAKGSAGRNVIPPEAAFISNLRLNPEDTMDSALAYLKETINDPAVEITKLEGMNPSRISETNCPAWDKVASAVAGTWKGCLVAPYLMVQCSDSRHYGRISDHVYRFSAMDLTAEERGTLHGNNERIRVETVGRAVEFYVRLMRQC